MPRTYQHTKLPRASREESEPATGDACEASVSCLKTASRGPLQQKSGNRCSGHSWLKGEKLCVYHAFIPRLLAIY
jgi:hypothetical protein